jgi:chromosome segregation ATPase
VSLRQDAALVFGLAGFLLGGTGAYLGWSALRATEEAQSLSAHDADMVESLSERVESLRRALHGEADPQALGGLSQELALVRRDLQETNRQLGAVRADGAQLRERQSEVLGRTDALVKELEDVRRRLDELEERQRAAAESRTDLVPLEGQ